MKPRRLLPPILLGGLLALIWSANAAPEPSETDPTRRPTAGFPRVVQLAGQTSLQLDRRPERVVVANTALVDLIVELLEPERVGALCDQAWTWSSLALEPEAAWRERPTFREFAFEPVLAFRPDLVLATVHSTPETVVALEAANVSVVRFGEPRDLAELRQLITKLGELLGNEAHAERLIGEINGRLDALRTPRPATRVAWYSAYGASGSVAGSDTLADAALLEAGLRNAAARYAGIHTVSAEELAALNPEFLIVPDSAGEWSTSTTAALRADPLLAQLDAVANDRIITIHPCRFMSTSHTIVTATERIVAAIDEKR